MSKVYETETGALISENDYKWLTDHQKAKCKLFVLPKPDLEKLVPPPAKESVEGKDAAKEILKLLIDNSATPFTPTEYGFHYDDLYRLSTTIAGYTAAKAATPAPVSREEGTKWNVIGPVSDAVELITRLHKLKKYHMNPYNLGDSGEMGTIVDKLYTIFLTEKQKV